MLLPAETHRTSLLIPRPECLSLAGRSLVCLLVTLSLFVAQLPNTFAQATADDDDVVRVSTDLLLFPVRIKDRKGQAVSGLTERDFSVRDNDHAITALHLSRGAERVALLFALDQSGSLRSIISQQRKAALALFGHFSQRSRVAVLRFAETPSLVATFGRDTEAVHAAFDFSVGNRRTAIFDAAAMAVETLNALPPDRAERRIVILISDGLDNASRIKPGQVIREAVEKHVSFYVIHLPLFEPRERGLAVRQPAKGFRDLAEKTGGKYFLAGDLSSALSPVKDIDLTPVFRAIEEDLKSQYLLGFYIAESARDGQRHLFSVGLVPEGIEYSVSGRSYSRKHQFFVNMK
jgi:Ca-activated chloride channel family protein